MSSQWYKLKPFNQNSVILYDFIVDNKLSVSYFNLHQNVNCTYSKGNVTSYIDHVLITENTRKIVKNFCIHADLANNTSDHLSLSTLIVLRPAYTMQYCVQNGLQHLACNTLQGILHVVMLHSC